MNRFGWISTIVLVGPLLGGLVQADAPESQESSPIHDKLRIAASVEDPVAREAALRKAMRETLLAGERRVRDAAYDCLINDLRRVDPRPFEDIWLEYDALEGRRYGSERLDFAELRLGPRESRLRALGEAVVTGSVRLRRGSILLRDVAMRGAARQGLDELQPVVLAHLEEVAPDIRKVYHLEMLPFVFSLRAGAADEDEAVDLAARRLAEMNPETYRRRMREEDGFRAVVMDVVLDAAGRGMPTANQPNPAWDLLRGMAERDIRAEQGEAMARGESAEKSSSRKTREEWLESIAGHFGL